MTEAASMNCRRLRSLIARAETLEKRLGGWADAFSSLVLDLGNLPLEPDDGRRSPRRLSFGAAEARAVRIRLRPSGAAVRIDAGDWFDVPPSLAELIALLCGDSGGDANQCSAWRPLDEIARHLGKDPASARDRHTVVVRISRLRRALHRGGVSPDLVQTCRIRGVRFAMVKQRSGAQSVPVTDGDLR